MVEKGEESADLFRGAPGIGFFHPPLNIDGGVSAVDDAELIERKKAQADLEREHGEVKRNIKSLMRLEPGSRVIDDPALADRVSGTRLHPQKYETAEDIATEKRMTSLLDNQP